MDKIGKVVAIILAIGISPLVICSILDAIGIIDIGTGLGLGLFMVASILLSVLVTLISAAVIGVKKLLKNTNV